MWSLLDVARNLDDAAVRVENAEAIASSRCLERSWFACETNAGRGERRGEGVYVRSGLNAKADYVEAPVRVSPETKDVPLRVALGCEEGDVSIVLDLLEAPGLFVESHGLVEIWRRLSYVT
jgi:hypothetical protein